MKCEDCRFWDRLNTFGLCVRHAPTYHIDRYGIEYAKFPLTSAGGWCGDFQQKETEESVKHNPPGEKSDD